MDDVVVRRYAELDGAWADAFLDEQLGGRLQARRGELLDVLALPGFVAGRAVGSSRTASKGETASSP